MRYRKRHLASINTREYAQPSIFNSHLKEKMEEDLNFVQSKKDRYTYVEKGSYGFNLIVRKGTDSKGRKVVIAKYLDVDKEKHNILAQIHIVQHKNIHTNIDTFYFNNASWRISDNNIKTTVSKLCRRNVDWPESHLLYVISQVLNGLQALHKAQLLFRNVEAGNLLVTPEGVIKLADFGRCANLKVRAPGRVLSLTGERYYLAPENISSKHCSYSVDIWATGITLIALAEGRTPYAGPHFSGYKTLFQLSTISPPKFVNKSKWSKELKELLGLLLTYDHTRRPTAQDLIQENIFNKKCKPNSFINFVDKILLQGDIY